DRLRPHLPRQHAFPGLLRPRPQSVERLRTRVRVGDLGGRDRDLRLPHRRHPGRLDHVPPARTEADHPARRSGSRPHPRPSLRTLRQLVQPGALRPADHPALGAGDRPGQSGDPARHSPGHPVPPDIPLRGDLAQPRRRFGILFTQHLFGLPPTLPWGLEIAPGNPAIPLGTPPDTLFHPTFLYEVIWNSLGALALLYLSRHIFFQWGRLFAVYLM